MKLMKMALVLAFAGFASISYAQDKVEKIKVLGNCGMCKKRIENSLKDAAIKSSVWDKETKFLTVTYDSTQLSSDVIQQKIAGVGHDTQKFKAKDEIYDKLPGCCKYDRSGKTVKAH